MSSPVRRSRRGYRRPGGVARRPRPQRGPGLPGRGAGGDHGPRLASADHGPVRSGRLTGRSPGVAREATGFPPCAPRPRPHEGVGPDQRHDQPSNDEPDGMANEGTRHPLSRPARARLPSASGFVARRRAPTRRLDRAAPGTGPQGQAGRYQFHDAGRERCSAVEHQVRGAPEASEQRLAATQHDRMHEQLVLVDQASVQTQAMSR